MAKRKKYIIIAVILFLLSPGFCLLYGYMEARHLKVRSMTYSDKDIPEAFNGKKIVFISDIHTNRYFTPEDVAGLVEKVNNLSPDFIFLGGDNTEKHEVYSKPFFEEIGKLKSTYGVFSVLGNHDHWEDAELIRQGLADCGFYICDNHSYWIKEGSDSIKIGGVGDFWEDQQLPDSTISDVQKTDFCILLSHNPDYLEKLDTDRIDLMFSGHTHAGQITFLGLWAPILPSTNGRRKGEYLNTGQKYRYGWKEKDGINLYVTSGIGMGGVPFRFFAPPEIVEITLQRDSD